jgi:hypothetical protein
MTLISPHWPPSGSCSILAKIGSGLSGLAEYWSWRWRTNIGLSCVLPFVEDRGLAIWLARVGNLVLRATFRRGARQSAILSSLVRCETLSGAQRQRAGAPDQPR